MKRLFTIVIFLFSYSFGYCQILPSSHGVHHKKPSGGGGGSGTRNFTNCSSTGINGPTQSNCNTAYASTDLNGEVTVSNGIQEWTVPTTGSYIIEVWAARGGGIGYSCTHEGVVGSTGCLGANGARMKGTFNLTQGDILRIAVGQMGEDFSNQGGGGGGGSFVAKGVNHAGATALIIAGGGGGGHIHTYRAVIPGQTTESALANTSNWSSGANYGPGEGGSWSGDGADSNLTNPSYGTAQGGKGWGSYLVGGQHSSGNPHWSLGDGGFGGGGGGSWGGGPGGGYNGGPTVKASGTGATSGGSGAGSYNSGSSQDNTVGAWNSHGKVTITW
jgi:hypothetical protein